MSRNILPSDWKHIQLRDVSEKIQYGYTESSSNEVVGPKFLRITDIQDNNVKWDKVPYCKIDSETKEKYLLAAGDLLFVRTGATVGKSFLIRGNIPEAVFASYLIRVRVNNEIDVAFLSLFFFSSLYWTQITDRQVGIGQPNVNGTKLGKLLIPLPPLPTQQKIVAKIEELFSELDKGKEQLETALQQLKIYRQAVLKWAFEGKLTNKEVKDGELSEEWKLKDLNIISNVISGNAFKSKDFINEGVPVIKIANIGYSEFLLKDQQYLPNKYIEDFEKFMIEEGDILIALTRPITNNRTKVCKFPADIGKSLLNQRVACLKNISINKDFLFLYFQTDQFKTYIRSNFSETLQPNLSPKALAKCQIPIPSSKEQNQIVQEIESRLSVCDKIEETLSNSLKQAESLRQSILKKAFEGKLV